MSQPSQYSVAREVIWEGLIDDLRHVIFAIEIYLTDHERGILMFIFRRTRMFGKTWERIPVRHFTDGVVSPERGIVAPSSGFNKNSVISALKSLTDKGLIQCRHHPTLATEYRVVSRKEVSICKIIDHLCRNQPRQLERIALQLRRHEARLPPQFTAALEAIRTRGDISRGNRAVSLQKSGVSRESKLIRQKVEKGDENRNIASGDAKYVEISFRGRKAKVIPRRNVGYRDVAQALTAAANWQLETRAQSAPKVTAVWKEAWHNGMSQFWPGTVVQFPDSVFRNLKTAVTKRGLPLEDVAPMLFWAVQNWRTLTTTVFTLKAGRQYGPTIPDVQFLISRLPQVHTEFSRYQDPLGFPMPRRDSRPPAQRDPFSLARERGLDFP